MRASEPSTWLARIRRLGSRRRRQPSQSRKCWSRSATPARNACLRIDGSFACGWRSGILTGLGTLAPSALQRRIQPLLLLFPAGIFGLRSPLDSVRLGLDGSGPLRMLPFSLVQRRLRLVDSLLSVFALFLPGRLFRRPLAISALLL